VIGNCENVFLENDAQDYHALDLVQVLPPGSRVTYSELLKGPPPPPTFRRADYSAGNCNIIIITTKRALDA
jgi:hypothetical protein